MAFSFDPATHTYTLDGTRVPGFSEIRVAMGIGDWFKPRGMAHYMDQGTALHSWFNILARGLEADELPDDRIAGRVEGIRKFLRDEPFQFLDGEKPMLCKTQLFACTPDAWGFFDSEPCVIELKRSASAKWHPLQTAAQATALRENGVQVQKRYALYLREGGYELEYHSNHSDFRRWTAIVNGFHARSWYC